MPYFSRGLVISLLSLVCCGGDVRSLGDVADDAGAGDGGYGTAGGAGTGGSSSGGSNAGGSNAAGSNAGGSYPGGDGAGGSGPIEACEKIVEATTKEEILAELAKLAFREVAPQSAGSLPITPQIRVKGTVEILSTDVPLPPRCSEVSNCEEMILSRETVPGVTGYGSAIRIEDTTIRLRPLLVDSHPNGLRPTVQVLGGCDTPCASGVRCANDGVCYNTERSARGTSEYCLYCEVIGQERCACRVGTSGTLADGVECYYLVSADIMDDGTCHGGICELDGN